MSDATTIEAPVRARRVDQKPAAPAANVFKQAVEGIEFVAEYMPRYTISQILAAENLLRRALAEPRCVTETELRLVLTHLEQAHHWAETLDTCLEEEIQKTKQS